MQKNPAKKKSSRRDIVIDANVMRLYDKPADPLFKQLFAWLASKGVLCVSPYLMREYQEAGNRDLAGLILMLIDAKRFDSIPKAKIDSFTDDKHYKYTCNFKDIRHARLVFLSARKRLVSFDKKLRDDVNGFRKVKRVQPSAVRTPDKSFYD